MIHGLNVVEVQDAPEVDDVDHLALLGRFEEAVVLATLACGSEATAGAIKARLTPLIGDRHINGVLTTLERLAKKGIIETIGKAAREGLRGRRCKTYQVTGEGLERVERGISVVANLARDAGLRRAA
jgi:DNA-binding PadR family transcriptional regulator